MYTNSLPLCVQSITQEIRLTPDEEVPGLTFTYSAGENCNMYVWNRANEASVGFSLIAP